MKVILTESQLNQLIQEEVNEANLLRSLLGLNSPDKIVSKLVLALLLGTIEFLLAEYRKSQKRICKSRRQRAVDYVMETVVFGQALF